jgi:hypothetical protein
MTQRISIPLDLKYDLAIRAYTSIHRGYLYAIREECGAVTALKIYERLINMGDRIKNLTTTVLKAFKIEENDVEAIAKWYDIWFELTGIEGTWTERSKTISIIKVTKCPFRTGYEDISEWCLTLFDLISKTINPKVILERPKGMCAGDPHCEYIFKIEE